MTKKIFFFGLSMLVFVYAFSADKTPNYPTFEMYVAGKINQCPVYRLMYENKGEKEFQIVWKDKYGTILHDEFVSGKQIVRNYMIDVSDLGTTELYVEINDQYGRRIQEFKMEKK
jgi:hypothetical protein